MGTTLTPDNIPAPRPATMPPGHDMKSLGPSDSSDSGSDMIGQDRVDTDMLEDSDRSGTGTRVGADLGTGDDEASDISPDRIVSASEAGLGGGLDQAEEARLGVTDEELDGAIEDIELKRGTPHSRR